MAVDPTRPSTVYATIADEQPYYGGFDLLRSTDSGTSWTRTNVSQVLSDTALVIDPSAPTTLYLGTNGGVFKSTDSGSTWASSSAGLPVAVVESLAIEGSTPTTLYAATYGAGVYKTEDSAATWTLVSTGLSNKNVMYVAPSPSSPSTLYAGVTDGVFRSTDSGETWVRAGQLISGIHDLAVHPTDPGTVYASTYGAGLFRSTDFGDTWTATTVHAGGTSMDSVVFDPITPTTIYALDGYDALGVYKSTDSGGSWTSVSVGLAPPATAALAVDPVAPSSIYAGAETGIFRSTDSGLSWSPSPTGPRNAVSLLMNPSTRSTLYAASASGFYRSTDSGGTWTQSMTGVYVTSLVLDPAQPSTLYASTFRYFATDAGVFKSTDAGGTWFPAQSGLPANLWMLAIDPVVTSTLYAGSWGGVFKSTDSGATWFSSGNGLTDLEVDRLAVSPSSPSTIYAGTEHGLVFRSTDGGGTWTVANTGLPGGAIRAIAVNPLQPSTLYTCPVSGGVFRSTDGGTRWTSFNSGIADLMSMSAISVDATGAVLHAGGPGVWSYTLSNPLGFFTLFPCRALDTRNPTGPSSGTPLGPGQVRTIGLMGSCGIPPGAVSLSANLTAVAPSAAGDLRIRAADQPASLSSAIHFRAGRTRANNLTFSLSQDGAQAITIQNEGSATVNVLFDVNGYFK